MFCLECCLNALQFADRFGANSALISDGDMGRMNEINGKCIASVDTLAFRIVGKVLSDCRRFKSIRSLACVIPLSLLSGLMPSQAQSQSSVEDGIRQLAQQIVERSASADKTTIAISAFPHVDDTCSELSNYLADELVLNLFSVPGNTLSIVERSQLDRIFSEIQLSMTGVVDINTTQELGRIAGVDTLLVGSITDIGDELRINARMLDTETAQVFSAAAVNIPRTSTVEQLFGRPSTNGCTMSSSSNRGAGDAGTVSSGRGGNGIAFNAGQLESFEQLLGHWLGVLDCGEKTWQVWVGFDTVLSNGVSGEFRGSWLSEWEDRLEFEAGNRTFRGSSSMVLVPTSDDDGPHFSLAVEQRNYENTFDLTLFGQDTLFGKPRNDCTSLNLGRVQVSE